MAWVLLVAFDWEEGECSSLFLALAVAVSNKKGAEVSLISSLTLLLVVPVVVRGCNN
jgi:hypothetical protein